MTPRTYLRADGQYARTLIRRTIRHSLITAHWQPPGGYTLLGLGIHRGGSVTLNLGRLELGRYRQASP